MIFGTVVDITAITDITRAVDSKSSSTTKPGNVGKWHDGMMLAR